jgi:hypothetical protein
MCYALPRRQSEQHNNWAGGQTYFTLYRLVEPHSISLAHKLIEQLKAAWVSVMVYGDKREAG